jgi:hypothetical protein
MTPKEYTDASAFVRDMWPHRHNMFMRVQMWNAIGAIRRQRIRQVRRYPYDRRFTVRV